MPGVGCTKNLSTLSTTLADIQCFSILQMRKPAKDGMSLIQYHKADTWSNRDLGFAFWNHDGKTPEGGLGEGAQWGNDFPGRRSD